jgi:hypothetical protein
MRNRKKQRRRKFGGSFFANQLSRENTASVASESPTNVASESPTKKGQPHEEGRSGGTLRPLETLFQQATV